MISFDFDAVVYNKFYTFTLAPGLSIETQKGTRLGLSIETQKVTQLLSRRKSLRKLRRLRLYTGFAGAIGLALSVTTFEAGLSRTVPRTPKPVLFGYAFTIDSESGNWSY